MSETEILKPSQKTVELDTDGYEDKDVVVQESKKENEKVKIVNEEVIPEGTVVNQHKRKLKKQTLQRQMILNLKQNQMTLHHIQKM